MRLHEILSERVLHFDLQENVAVLENPSAWQVVNMFDHTDLLRALWNPQTDELWFWDGKKAIHFQIAALVGVPLKETGQLVLIKQSDHRVLLKYFRQEARDDVAQRTPKPSRIGALAKLAT